MLKCVILSSKIINDEVHLMASWPFRRRSSLNYPFYLALFRFGECGIPEIGDLVQLTVFQEVGDSADLLLSHRI